MSFLSVLIVTFNNELTIRDCLSSLQRQSWKDSEIVLVDNDSTDGTRDVVDTIHTLSPFRIKRFYLDRNLGFAGGNNFGLQHASGTYIALLNPDGIADPLWLEKLSSAMDEHREVGVCASKMIAYGTDRIDSAGDGYATSLKGFKRGEGESIEGYRQPEFVFGACAGAGLYRKTMLDQIGFFDPDFFLIHEDTDLNFRAQLAGWKILYVPEAIVYHKVRSSIGAMSDLAVYYTLRNSELVRIKNVPWPFFLFCLPEFIISLFTEFFYFGIRHRRIRLFSRAKRDVLRILPATLRKRGAIMKRRKVKNGGLFKIMTPVWERDFFEKKLKKLFQG
jgi:GT2 family glycosyltransferase